MPQFTYRARNKEGHEVQVSREAASEEELIAQLQQEGLLVTSVIRQESAKKKAVLGSYYHTRVTIDDLIIFAKQLSTLLEAGVTLLKGLDVLSKQIESLRLREVIEKLRNDISRGSSFRDALARHPKVFSSFWVHMAETGEASGALPVALGQLADYMESAAAIRSKVTSALIYPAVLVGVAFVALLIFTVWVIPMFSMVFETFEMELPVLTTAVLATSQFLRKYILVLLIMLVATIFLVYKYIHTDKGKTQLDRLILKLPVLSSLFQRIATERFASSLATLIESGVPILYGLEIAGKAIGNKVVEEAIAEVKEGVRQGKGMAQYLEKSGIFTPMVVQMVTVGEEVGDLGKMLRKISEFYRERIATALTRLTTLIEPAILIFMGVVVGILVVSMFLPIFQLAMVSGK